VNKPILHLAVRLQRKQQQKSLVWGLCLLLAFTTVAQTLRSGAWEKEGTLMRRIVLLVTVALSLVAMLFVVSATGAQKQATAGAQKQATRTVLIQNFRFSPAHITVKPGKKVAWVNKGGATHTATANNGAFDSGTLQPGESFSRTFRKSGKFNYHCEIHPKMTGSVTVKRRR
jgi:plastocyanin